MTRQTWRRKIHELLETSDRTGSVSNMVDVALIALIAINVVAVVVATVDWVHVLYRPIFRFVEIVSIIIFSVEYVLRVWCSIENEELQGAKFPRLAHACTPLAIIDLAAILPFYLSFFFVIDLRFLRVMRLLRIFKLARYSSAMTMLLDVFREEANAFFAGFFILGVLLIIVASGAYLVEHDAQPDKFGSIPHAMWWAMATLTTVGYGDVTPITGWGKLFGAMVTVIGIGMAALPAGILASGLADQLRRKRQIMEAKFRKVMADGTIDADEEAKVEELRRTLGLSKRLARDIREDINKKRTNATRKYCPHCGEKLSEPY